MAADDILRIMSVPAWLLCLACSTLAVWRLFRNRGRYIDPLLAVLFLEALNRLSFVLRVSAELSHASAIVLAVTMAGFALWYQRHDR